MKITVSRDEVLAWIAADPATRGPTEAAKTFGIKKATVTSWQRRQRIAAGVATAQPGGATGVLHVLPALAPEPDRKAVEHTVTLPPKPTLPPSMQGLARRATRAMLERMVEVAPRADAKETAAMFAALTDRFDILGTIKPERRKASGEPGTPEWMAEQVELAAALPPEVIAEAARRQKGA